MTIVTGKSKSHGKTLASRSSRPLCVTALVQIFYSDYFLLPLPEGHRLPMQKYSLLRQRVMQAGLSGGEALREPHAATEAEIVRAHDAD